MCKGRLIWGGKSRHFISWKRDLVTISGGILGHRVIGLVELAFTCFNCFGGMVNSANAG